jgi:hypothetical protein
MPCSKMDRLSVDDCQGAPCQAEFVSEEEVWTVLIADTDTNTDAHTVNHKSLGMESDDGERNILMIAVEYSYWMTSIFVVVVVVVVAAAGQCSLPYLLVPVDDAVQEVWMGRFTIGGFILPSWTLPMVEEAVVNSRKSSRGSRRVGQSFIKRRLYFCKQTPQTATAKPLTTPSCIRQACTMAHQVVTQTSPS